MTAAAKPAASTGKQQRFAPLPLRALRDQRLGGLHLRTLGIIAAFDRLGKNGSGCWASQNTIAKIAGVDKARLSRSLSDLREFGYISSQLNPLKRWFRVHRVIYTDEDAHVLDDKSVASDDNRFDKSVAKSGPISCQNRANQLHGTSENNSQNNDLKKTTIVPTRTRTIDEPVGEFEGQNCAEARSRSAVSEPEKYLTDLETLAASSERDNLKFERACLEAMAGDPCLPEELNERAAQLLSKIRA